MKKWMLVLAIGALLSGCGKTPVYETVTDTLQKVELPPPMQMVLQLPEGTNTPVLKNDQAGEMYILDHCVITVQIAPGGDLESTMRTATGYSLDMLEVMETQSETATCYECVWTAAGESETQVGRACILDDGNYHYVVTAMADASEAAQMREEVQQMFDSIKLISPEINVSTGS